MTRDLFFEASVVLVAQKERFRVCRLKLEGTIFCAFPCESARSGSGGLVAGAAHSGVENRDVDEVGRVDGGDESDGVDESDGFFWVDESGDISLSSHFFFSLSF